jgi:hypothetical protein
MNNCYADSGVDVSYINLHADLNSYAAWRFETGV